ncbi:MAG: ankyrin repeat domain-containing protein [Holophaga sp.]|nr:ankyrin repeat domain-containing protein [Holophaga sp.]
MSHPALKLILGVILGASVGLHAGASLIKAATKGKVDAVKQCLDAGENVNEADKYGWTPLMWSVYYKHLPVTVLLLEKGADPNIQATYKNSRPAGTSALHIAAYYGFEDQVAALVKKGARANLVDGNGKTPIDLAQEYRFTAVLELLGNKSSSKTLPVGKAIKTVSGVELNESFLSGDRKKILKEMADRLSAGHPSEAYILAESGRAYLAGMEAGKGRETLMAAEEQGLKDGQALRLIGLAWLKNGNKAEAMASYDKVLQRDSGNQQILARCAVDLIEVGLLPEAEKFMKSVLGRDPKAWEPFLEFGRAYLLSGQRKQASAWFVRALEANPGDDKVVLEIMRAFADSQALM